MKFTFITLFENLVKPYFCDSILKRAISNNFIEIDFINPRNFTNDKHNKVDDYMIFLTPAGKKFSQNDAKRLSKKDHICFVCSRYEGLDERVVELWADEVFCIGDFILTGGELPALCMSDAISRNVPGVLGNDMSLEVESFEGNLLEAPSFTKPDNFRSIFVVSEFLKGNHAKIHNLKNKMAHCKTRYFRPDLYQKLKPHK